MDDLEKCPNCKSDVEPWKLLPPGQDHPDGLCDECRPQVVIPDWAWYGPCTGFTI